MIGQGTAADTEGTSAAGTLSFLARSPQGRTSQLWHVLLMLGPRPIKTMWNAPSVYLATRRAGAVEDGVNRLLAATTDPNPDDAAQLRLQDATDGIPIDLLARASGRRVGRSTAHAIMRMATRSCSSSPPTPTHGRFGWPIATLASVPGAALVWILVGRGLSSPRPRPELVDRPIRSTAYDSLSDPMTCGFDRRTPPQ